MDTFLPLITLASDAVTCLSSTHRSHTFWFKVDDLPLMGNHEIIKLHCHCEPIYQSIYLYTQLISSLRGGSQDKVFRVWEVLLPSSTVPCLCIGVCAEEGLPTLLTPSLVIAFYELREIRW